MEQDTTQAPEPAVSAETLSGVSSGTVLPSNEVVVEDVDADGNVIGWHKEVKESA